MFKTYCGDCGNSWYIGNPRTCTCPWENPKREWVGLTQEEFSEIYNRTEWNTVTGWEYERAIEAKLKAKNGFHSTEKNT